MITRIPAEERHFVNISWMQAYWLFSYGEGTSGSVSLNGTLLEEGDQARVSSQSRALSLASATGGSFVLVDVAAWRAADRSY